MSSVIILILVTYATGKQINLTFNQESYEHTSLVHTVHLVKYLIFRPNALSWHLEALFIISLLLSRMIFSTRVNADFISSVSEWRNNIYNIVS